MEVTRNKINFLLIEGLVFLSLLVSFFFFTILIWGIPEMNPYPANPFLLFTFFSFTTYLGFAYLQQKKDWIAGEKWDVFLLTMANLSTVIWLKYLLLSTRFVFAFIYLIFLLASLICWLGYLFVDQSWRFWLKWTAIYLCGAAVVYYIFYPFLSWSKNII